MPTHSGLQLLADVQLSHCHCITIIYTCAFFGAYFLRAPIPNSHRGTRERRAYVYTPQCRICTCMLCSCASSRLHISPTTHPSLTQKKIESCTCTLYSCASRPQRCLSANHAPIPNTKKWLKAANVCFACVLHVLKAAYQANHAPIPNTTKWLKAAPVCFARALHVI